jgi:putative NADPH-quinone reductase
MKIVAINGSHRGERGYTQFLIDKVFQGARPVGAQCETIVLAQHTIHPCSGCRVCHTEKSYLKCVYHEKDDVSQLFEIMRSADMLIYATPVYIFTMTGLMKTFLDRITSTGDSSIPALSEAGLFFHHIDKQLVSKPFVLLTCQDNFESETSKNVVSYFETFSKFLDAPFVGILLRTSGALVGHGKNKEKEAGYPRIQPVYNALITAGEEFVNTGKISKKTQKIANQRIIDIPKPIEFMLKFRFIRKNRRIMEKIFQKAPLQIAEHRAVISAKIQRER